MYVRARFIQSIATNAILAPQQAVSRDPRGNATVYVVAPGNKAAMRVIKADRTVDDKWLVTEGLSPGDKVITEGLDKVKPNQPVRPVPAGSPPRRPPGGGQGGAGQGGRGPGGGPAARGAQDSGAPRPGY
jgi:membrane fusion protein (multidrug efflux system)